MNKEEIIANTKPIQEELSPEDMEAKELLDTEGREIKREKADYRSARRVLYHLLKEGDITAQDKLIDVLRVIEEEYAQIENI